MSRIYSRLFLIKSLRCKLLPCERHGVIALQMRERVL